MSDWLSEFATHASIALSGIVSVVTNSPRYQTTTLTWDRDRDGLLNVFLVTLTEETYQKQWQAYVATDASDRKRFKPQGGIREVLGSIDQYHGQQALECQLLQMYRPRVFERSAHGRSAADEGEKVSVAVKRVANEIWLELTAAESNVSRQVTGE